MPPAGATGEEAAKPLNVPAPTPATPPAPAPAAATPAPPAAPGAGSSWSAEVAPTKAGEGKTRKFSTELALNADEVARLFAAGADPLLRVTVTVQSSGSTGWKGLSAGFSGSAM